MGDRTRGYYDKFEVRRVDGGDEPGERHHGCRYFVLDLTHDLHARTAARAYAGSCGADGYENLAADLFGIVRQCERDAGA